MPTRSRKLLLDNIDTYRLVADAQIHPDGSCVAFVVSALTHDRDKTTRSNIWITDTAGTSTRQFTFAAASEVHPRWSPDGKMLAFASDRAQNDLYQIYLIPREGGEAQQITFGPGLIKPHRDVTMFKWSPDGTRIAFLQPDAPDQESAQRRTEGYDEIEFEAKHSFTRVWLVDIKTRKTHIVTRGEIHAWELDWSPDGKELALVCSTHPYEWSWYDVWLARVPASGGAPRKIFTRLKKQVAHPRWSPDGHHIAFVSSLWSDRAIISGDVYLTDTNGKNARRLSEGYKGSASGIEWIDNHALVGIGFLQGEAALAEFDIEGAYHPIWQGEGAFQESYSPKFSRAQDGTLAVIRSAPNMPREVWILSPNGGNAPLNLKNRSANEFQRRPALVWEQLTNLNASFLNREYGEHELVKWTGAEGHPMQGLIVKPVGSKNGKHLPLIVHPHGGPTGITPNEFFSPTRWVYHLTQRGFAVFMPNYRGSVGWGIEFAEANIGDMGGRDFEDIMKGVDALVERGIADPKRLGIGGWSYGGFLTAWAITQTHRFKAAIVGAGIANWLSFHGTSYLSAWDALHYDADPYERGGVYDKFSPLHYISRVKTPTLILHGEKDGDVPVSQGYELFRALKERAVETEFVIYPREPHAIGETPHVKDLLTRVCDWFEIHLKK